MREGVGVREGVVFLESFCCGNRQGLRCGVNTELRTHMFISFICVNHVLTRLTLLVLPEVNPKLFFFRGMTLVSG